MNFIEYWFFSSAKWKKQEWCVRFCDEKLDSFLFLPDDDSWPSLLYMNSYYLYSFSSSEQWASQRLLPSPSPPRQSGELRPHPFARALPWPSPGHPRSSKRCSSARKTPLGSFASVERNATKVSGMPQMFNDSRWENYDDDDVYFCV